MLQPLPCPPGPFDIVGIDLYEPLPVTPTGHRLIVTSVDHLTRYAETAPLSRDSAFEVAEFFLQAIFYVMDLLPLFSVIVAEDFFLQSLRKSFNRPVLPTLQGITLRRMN